LVVAIGGVIGTLFVASAGWGGGCSGAYTNHVPNHTVQPHQSKRHKDDKEMVFCRARRRRRLVDMCV